MTKKEEVAKIIESRHKGDLLLALNNDKQVVEILREDPQLTEELIAAEMQRRGYSLEPAEGELFIGDYEYRMKIIQSEIATLRKQVAEKLKQ